LSDSGREHERIQPAAFRPPRGEDIGRRRLPRPLHWLFIAVLLLFTACAWFVFTVQPIHLQFAPEPDAVAIEGGLSLPIGDRYLLRPGTYVVVAEKAGYRRLETEIEIAAGDNAVFSFALEKLPGRLRVMSEPIGATVKIDGKVTGEAPLTVRELKPGRHALTVQAHRYQAYHRDLKIEGKGKLQTLAVKLSPAWAPITLKSKPAGATLVVDGQPRGTTPLTADIGAGVHTVVLELDGYQRWRRELEVVADQARGLPLVRLAKARGRLHVTSEPAGASVRLDEHFRGHTPLALSLAPGRSSVIKLTKAGYELAAREVSLASGEEADLSVALTPILGTVRLVAEPADAIAYVDGQPRGPANQALHLTAVAHNIAIHKPGYAPYQTTVTPQPGLAQTVTARLLTEAQAKLASLPSVIETGAGQRLRLIQPARFTMGAPRREQGRRANEVPRDVELTRLFYIAVHEVTNAQFRRFRPGHSSGIVASTTLDNGDYPVARVSWEDAAAYCNWLSAHDGLPKAYRRGRQGLELVRPVTTGYRLPTEAEWEWAARMAGGHRLKYPWGDAMPPTGAAGNYADRSAADLLNQHLKSYDDGYAAAAPVGQFPTNALGLHDLGGNVAEWVHDPYSADLALSAEIAVDPLGPASGSAHTVRGSSWRHGRITELRLSYRKSGIAPRDDLGFRIARYVE
jgi:formylglycine-generating enzyme required for sulfatase activity